MQGVLLNGVDNMKIHQNLLVLLLCLVCLTPLVVISDSRVKGNITVEEVTLETRYIHPIMGTQRFSEFKIRVLTPEDSSEAFHGPLPVVIVLHGDTIGEESTIMVQRQLIDNGFMVITLEIETFEIYQTILDLNNTLNYLLTRSDVIPSQICMYGHSRGALYSLLFGAIRKDVIQGVVSANFAEYGIYYGYVSVLATYLIPNFLASFSPNSVLFAIDERDMRQDDESHVFSTNWEPTTGFQVFLSSTSIGHASGVYNYEALHTEITWVNSILGRTLSSPAEEATSFHSLETIQQFLSTTLICPNSIEHSPYY